MRVQFIHCYGYHKKGDVVEVLCGADVVELLEDGTIKQVDENTPCKKAEFSPEMYLTCTTPNPDYQTKDTTPAQENALKAQKEKEAEKVNRQSKVQQTIAAIRRKRSTNK